MYYIISDKKDAKQEKDIQMKQDTRSLIRTLSGISAGIGIFLAMGAAGTSDYRDALQYEDEAVRQKAESETISENSEKNMMVGAFVTLGLATVGLALTEKKSNQR